MVLETYLATFFAFTKHFMPVLSIGTVKLSLVYKTVYIAARHLWLRQYTHTYTLLPTQQENLQRQI